MFSCPLPDVYFFIMHKLFVLHFYISIDIYVWRFHRLVISQQSAVLAYKGQFFFFLETLSFILHDKGKLGSCFINVCFKLVKLLSHVGL